MYRVLNGYRSYVLRPLAGLARSVQGFFKMLFPFFFYPHISERAGVQYTYEKDHLFMPDVFSIRKYWHKETVSLLILLGLFFVGALSLLTLTLQTAIPVILTGIVAFFYLFLVIFKLWVVYEGFSYPLVDFTQAELDTLTDDELPTYTVFVPLKYEAEVIDQIVKAMSSLDYPSHKINMIVAVEKYDTETIEAIRNTETPSYFNLEILEFVEPQTKPKTLNMIFKKAKGEFLVIYDAEIIPDPDQMKKAYLAFRKHPDIACFQTRLEHYNTDQNLLTRLFNIEFSFYYDYFLPGLQKLGFPIPLSGHSTHFRLEVLRNIGGWDPYNVAEDCDIGMRIYRKGYKTGILDSLSQEEAAGTTWSWIKQRTRWMKGFIQTSIVHLRHPLRTKKEFGGWGNFAAFLLTVPGTVFINVLNLASWLILFFWLFTGSEFIKGLYPQPILYISVTAFIVGMFLFTYLNLIGAFNRDKFHLIKYGLFTPVYWLLLAFATTRAFVQTFTSPFSWEKTEHGTHLK